MLYSNVVDLTKLDVGWLQNSRYLPSYHAATVIDKGYLDNLLVKLMYLKNITSARQHAEYREPKLCGSVLHINFVPEKWVMIPCKDVLNSNYFLCENKLHISKSHRQYLSKRTPHYCGKTFTLISINCFIVSKYTRSINANSVLTIDESLNRYLTRWSIGNDFRNSVIISNRGIVEYLVTNDFPHQRLKLWHQVQINHGIQIRYKLNRRAVQLYTQTCNFNRHYACPDSTCILLSHVCDGVIDCDDGRDEMACEDILCANKEECLEKLTITNSTCSLMHHRCSSDCIRLDQVCDWRADCADNSDERNCNALSDVHGEHFKWQIASDSVFQVTYVSMIVRCLNISTKDILIGLAV